MRVSRLGSTAKEIKKEYPSIGISSDGISSDLNRPNRRSFSSPLSGYRRCAPRGEDRLCFSHGTFRTRISRADLPGKPPGRRKISGLKAYPGIKDIPGPVDLAIILVPVAHVLSIVKECAAKGVKGAVLFTAGFKETGTEEGRALEEAVVRVARSAGMRLVGPNGMGLYCPKTGLSFFPGVSKDPGPVGIISHSGSLTNILGNIAPQKGLRFSKVISSGNDCDLTAADFITYLGHDTDTTVIGGYIEGIKDGPYFLRALKQASLKKPVIIWKVGLTAEGSRASASHTGALSGSRKIWQAVESQTGAIPVVGFEAWIDALMGFSLLPAGLGRKVAIISGPGGLAVSAAEALGNEGLGLASLSEQTQDRLNVFIPPTGTSLRNPVDVSLSAFFDRPCLKNQPKSWPPTRTSMPWSSLGAL